MQYEILTDLRLGGMRFEVEIQWFQWDRDCNENVVGLTLLGVYADYYGDRGDYAEIKPVEVVLGEMSPADLKKVDEALVYALKNEHRNFFY